MLQEIQRTGDIFFPLDWTNAVLGGHNSTAAAQTVTSFLAAQKDYPPRLRQVIEQNADQLITSCTDSRAVKHVLVTRSRRAPHRRRATAAQRVTRALT